MHVTGVTVALVGQKKPLGHQAQSEAAAPPVVPLKVDGSQATAVELTDPAGQ